MVVFRDDLDTFCKYITCRPPNVDGIVHQYCEDRHLEKAVRGLYYVAYYRHCPVAGEEISVSLDQYYGRLDPDDDNHGEAEAAARKCDEIALRVDEATIEAGGSVHKGPMRYTGEIIPRRSGVRPEKSVEHLAWQAR